MTKSEEYLEKAFKLINDNISKAHVSGEKSEVSVLKAENVLGVIFSPTYKNFIGKYGMCSIAGEEIYGITNNENYEKASIPNGIWLTLDYYKKWGLPVGIILISETGDGDYYGIDTRQKDANGESPIVLWRPCLSKPEDVLEIIASDFGTFLYETISEAIERRKKKGIW